MNTWVKAYRPTKKWPNTTTMSVASRCIWVNHKICRELIECSESQKVVRPCTGPISDWLAPCYVELSTIVEESPTFFGDALFDTIDKLRPEEQQLISGSRSDTHHPDISIVSEIQHSAFPDDSRLGAELHRGKSARMVSLERQCCSNEHLLPIDTDFTASAIDVLDSLAVGAPVKEAESGTKGLSENEVKNMQLNEYQQFLDDLTQQELKRAILPLKLFRGSLGFLCIGSMGLVLALCGKILESVL